ncbi:MAG: cell division protein ZapE [Gammaproteobacteria bacterium]|nr:cell division protein ZapE [Gammaproteobacteria bacterium]
MNLSQRYAAALQGRSFAPDPAQQHAVMVLERVARELAQRRQAGGAGRLLRRLRGKPLPPVRGAYLWGEVGRGKTFVMDLFCEGLPQGEYLRYHFHRLMYRVHARLALLKEQPDPLATVAAELAAQARVLCFDEFFVTDIADAMILGKLFEGLFRHGVTLVATSNIPPGELYRDGLQRQRFLPAIALIKQHAEVVHVDGTVDYRRRVLEQAEVYCASLDAGAEAHLEAWFSRLAAGPSTSGQAMEINGRDLATRRRAAGVAWFDFATLCQGPRSQDDYIEIARVFHAVILSGIPVLGAEDTNAARRFIALVDEFYDRRVKLIASAAAPIDEIYRGQRLAREFERTRSRLREMQSRDYLASPHLP